GLYKYNRVPKNHMAAEADNNTWAWYAGGKGAHFSGGLNSILNPKTLDLWGIAHELGHINQTRPGLKWTGTTEVTNNIHSAYVIYLLTPNNCRLEKEQTNDAYYSGIETGTGSGKSNSMIGGRFNAYLNNAIMKSQVWLFQYGSDNVKTASAESDWTVGGDFFVRFAPMWQLTLYYNVARPDKKDWWGDVAEKVRNTNESGLNGGKLQVNFMKNTCDAVGEDLTDFFRNAGMLRTFSKNVDDYGVANITLTAADSASVVSYVASKGYPKPESPVIYYLSANNVHVFRDKLALEGTTGAGCSPVLTAANDYQKYVTIDHAVWKNAVVFETYAGAELVRISMVGSGYANNSKTRVYFPNNATSIYAVAWDGSKKLVYGEANKITENYNKNISITPNPTNEKIQMNGFKGSANFILTDLSGKKLMSQTILENESVPVSFLSNGIYIGHIVTSEGNASKKIIKN
ncbi:MAG TPA: M60 family metallopeptidase, partial [Paludibacter sp.]|nr:M60 family metallopeptidase [Paludibacter sp.]